MRAYNLSNISNQATSLTELYLDRSGLQEVPEIVRTCQALRVLDLGDNQLDSLPAWLGELAQLEQLVLSGNQFQEWPEALKSCLQLRQLRFDKNELKKVREQWIPKNLESLHLAANQIRTFNLSVLLPNLKSLDLSQNRLVKIPDLSSTIQLETLVLRKNKIKEWHFPERVIKGLQFLDIGQNKLNTIGKDIGELSSLRYLHLDQNQLISIPTEIGSCTALRSVHLQKNKLLNLPKSIAQLPWLIEVDVSHNQFSQVPYGLKKLTRLDKLYLQRNQLGPKFEGGTWEQLRILDLGHNQIERLMELPKNLRQLVVRYNPLKKIKGLKDCRKLEILDLTKHQLSKFPVDLLQLIKLEKIKGIFPATESKEFIKLLKGMESMQLGARDRSDLFDFWKNPNTAPVNKKAYIHALIVPINSLQKKGLQGLLDEEGEEIPDTIREIQILGNLPEGPKLEESGMQVVKNTSNVVIGKGPYQLQKQNWKNKKYYSIPQLQTFLRKRKNKAPQSEWTPQHIRKLQRLLLHRMETQVKLALLLLQDKTIPSELFSALILAWKLQENPKQKLKLRQYVSDHLPVSYQSLISRRLKIQRAASLMEKESAIRDWLVGSNLEQSSFFSLLEFI